MPVHIAVIAVDRLSVFPLFISIIILLRLCTISHKRSVLQLLRKNEKAPCGICNILLHLSHLAVSLPAALSMNPAHFP